MKLKKIHNTCYADHYGYYIYTTDDSYSGWMFLPLEKYYITGDLLNISNTLSTLNESNHYDDTEILQHDGWGEYVNLSKLKIKLEK